jgi:hypothetical protein
VICVLYGFRRGVLYASLQLFELTRRTRTRATIAYRQGADPDLRHEIGSGGPGVRH